MVKIYTVHDKREDFILFQHKTFSKLLLDEYQLIICNNATDKIKSEKIKKICKQKKLQCLDIPEQHHENPNIACSYPLDYLTQEIIANDTETSVSVIIDSDIFLVQSFSFISFIEDYKVAGVKQQRGEIFYLWNALFIFNHEQLSRKEIQQIIFADSGSENSRYYPSHYYTNKKICGSYVDVGGPTYFFITEPGNKTKYISASRITEYYNNIDLLPQEIREYYHPFYSSAFGKGEKSSVACDMLLDNTFFHYRAGSNWNGLSEEASSLKTAILEEIIQLALKGKIPKKRNDEIIPDELRAGSR